MRRKPFNFLNKLDSNSIEFVAELIVYEHPQTIALISSFLNKQTLKIIFQNIPQHLISQVMMRMTRLDKVSIEVIEVVETQLKKKLEEEKKMYRFNVENSLNTLRDIIEELPANQIRDALKAINNVDVTTFNKLTNHIAESSPEKLI